MTRECGTCTLCCKVMAVATLSKPRGVWCDHALPGRGCGIYDTRPQDCRTFVCLWLRDESLGPDWKPEKSKMVLAHEEATGHMLVYLDPSTPRAWQRAPYMKRLTALMQAGLPLGRLVFIMTGERTGVLLPDERNEGRLEDLGRLEAGDEVSLRRLGYPHATRYEAVVKRRAS